MSLEFKKSIYYLIWIFLIAIGPITIARNTPLELVLTDEELLTNFLQRLTGLLAFTLLAWQLVIGALMPRLTEKLGGWVFNFHVKEGLWIWGIILVHPFLNTILTYQTTGLIDPLATLLPNFSTRQEIWYSFGRFALLLITIAFLAGYFRNKPFLRRNWRKFHILNYAGFVFVAIHAYFSGTDTWTSPFSWFFWLAIASVAAATGLRLNSLRKSIVGPKAPEMPSEKAASTPKPS